MISLLALPGMHLLHRGVQAPQTADRPHHNNSLYITCLLLTIRNVPHTD